MISDAKVKRNWERSVVYRVSWGDRKHSQLDSGDGCTMLNILRQDVFQLENWN